MLKLSSPTSYFPLKSIRGYLPTPLVRKPKQTQSILDPLAFKVTTAQLKMATLLKFIYFILLSFSLQLLTLIAVTTAQETKSPANPWFRSMNLLRPRDEIESFICQTTETSPFNNHVIFGTDEMINENGHHWCTQENSGGSRCTQVFRYGTASTAMCGEPKAKLRCKEVGEAVKELTSNCARDFQGKMRVAGRVTFSWGYIIVGKWLVPDPPMNSKQK